MLLTGNIGMQGNVLEFSARLDIAIDVAHAVTYLHMYIGKLRILDEYLNFFSRTYRFSLIFGGILRTSHLL